MNQDKYKNSDNLDGSIFALLFFGWLSLYLGSSSGYGSVYHTFGRIYCILPGLLVSLVTPDNASETTTVLKIGFICGSVYAIKKERFIRAVINVILLFVSWAFSDDIVSLVAQKKELLKELDTIRDDLNKKSMEMDTKKEALDKQVDDLNKRETEIRKLEDYWNDIVQNKKRLIDEQVQLICDQQRKLKEIRSVKDKLKRGIEQEVYGMKETTNYETSNTLVSRIEFRQGLGVDEEFDEEEFMSHFRDFDINSGDDYIHTKKMKQEETSIKGILNTVSTVSTVLSVGAFVFRVFRRKFF